jgi:hypothetical protein
VKGPVEKVYPGDVKVKLLEGDELQIAQVEMVELGDVKDLTIARADGKKLKMEEAIKKLTVGTTVVVAGDGKPVSPVFLKMFKDEILVLTSPELTGLEPGAIQTMKTKATPGEK